MSYLSTDEKLERIAQLETQLEIRRLDHLAACKRVDEERTRAETAEKRAESAEGRAAKAEATLKRLQADVRRAWGVSRGDIRTERRRRTT